ncbi:BufA2 family periplasmic bufferin-type metallophore [Chitinibacteraceae bacterium HSL-7]
MNRVSGATLAAAAAALFAAAPAVHAEKAEMVKCAGINGCKGQSKCQTAESACAGQNSCKGHGWLPAKTEKECTDKGGKAMM